MSGIGGDEILAGYRKHIAHRWAASYRRLPRLLRDGVIEPAARALPTLSGRRVADVVRFTKKMVRSASLPPDDGFLMNSTYITEADKSSLLRGEVWREMEAHDPWSRHLDHFSRVAGVNELNRLLYVDTKTFMTSLNLTYNDKMSMAASTEVRVPFLDTSLVEFMASEVPPSMKLHAGRRTTTKYLLRRAMEGVLPAEVLHQPKAGFGAPISGWITDELRPMIGDVLSDTRIEDRGLFEPAAVRRMIAAHRTGEQDSSLQIWSLLTLELWQQAFLDAAVKDS